MTHCSRLSLFLPFLMLLAAGCAGGAGGMGSSRDEDEKPEKTYAGLAGQTAAVYVWADWRTRTEYATVQVDLARAFQQRLIPPAEKDADSRKARSAPPVDFINPASVVRYQREHPEVESLPITEVAPRLGVARVIYIEIHDFQAQSPETILLLKGVAEVDLRVIEVVNRQATVVFEEKGIKVQFPPGAPEGVPANDKVTLRTVYDGTIQALARKLALRFPLPSSR